MLGYKLARRLGAMQRKEAHCSFYNSIVYEVDFSLHASSVCTAPVQVVQTTSFVLSDSPHLLFPPPFACLILPVCLINYINICLSQNIKYRIFIILSSVMSLFSYKPSVCCQHFIYAIFSFPQPLTILRNILLINKFSQHNVLIIFYKYSTWFHFLSIFLLNLLYPYSFCYMTLFALYILFHFISKVFHFSINLWKMMALFSIHFCFLPNPHTLSRQSLYTSGFIHHLLSLAIRKGPVALFYLFSFWF